MRTKINYIKIYILSLFIISGSCIYAQDYGNFPFFESFLTKTPSHNIKFPKPTGGFITSNSATPDTNGLILTENKYTQFGGIYIDNHEITAKNGVLIEFEYMAYGGDGGDGLSVFLFNALEQNPGIGASGAGIGYAYNRSVNGSQFGYLRAKGVPSGFLGIAFDSYGNFKGRRYQGESRVNGIESSVYTDAGLPIGDWTSGDDVTLRGAAREKNVTNKADDTGTTIPGMSIGYVGYPVLATQHTSKNVGFIYNPYAIKYERKDQLKTKTPFSVRGGTYFEKSTDPGYRKAFIELYPNGEEGFYVTVIIQHELAKDTVIFDYNYKMEFPYLENAMPGESGSWKVTDGDNNPTDFPYYRAVQRILKITVPLKLKIGFAAATGTPSNKPGAPNEAKNDRHVIKNVGIRLPRAAEAYDDFADDQEQGVSQIVFYPLRNDLGYEGVIRRDQKGSSEHLLPGEFRFLDKDGIPHSDPFYYAEPGVGTWQYVTAAHPNDARVIFRPESTYKGNAAIKYNIKGGRTTPTPYNDEAYRSLPATIGVFIKEREIGPGRNIISNRNVTIKLTK